MYALGDYNTLRILRFTDPGIYLDGGEAGDILLPRRFVTPQMHVGDDITVFVYLDQDERPVATTEKPIAKVGEFACLEVAWTNRYGAFLKWGLMKDLFCPFREQKQRMEQGRSYIVYIKVDEESYRLMATAKVERYLSPAPLPAAVPAAAPTVSTTAAPTVSTTAAPAASTTAAPATTPDGSPSGAHSDAPSVTYKHGDAVDCLVWQKTDLGFKVIVDNRYQGQLYDNQIFRPLHSGHRLTAYIDHVRQDGKIDLTLQPTGRQQTLDFAEVLLRYLYENDGHCDLDDHTPAELIADRFKVSKKVFKKAVGDLYRRRLITIAPDGLHLAR